MSDREFLASRVDFLNAEHERRASNNSVTSNPSREGLRGRTPCTLQHASTRWSALGSWDWEKFRVGVAVCTRGSRLRACDERGSSDPDLREPGAMDTCTAEGSERTCLRCFLRHSHHDAAISDRRRLEGFHVVSLAALQPATCIRYSSDKTRYMRRRFDARCIRLGVSSWGITPTRRQ